MANLSTILQKITALEGFCQELMEMANLSTILQKITALEGFWRSYDYFASQEK